MKIVYSHLDETGKLVTSPAEITRGVAKGIADLRVTPEEGRPFRVSNARKADVPTAKCFSPAVRKSEDGGRKSEDASAGAEGEKARQAPGGPGDAASVPSNSTN